MNLHEYQAKKILQKFGVDIPPFAVASNLNEVWEAMEDLQLDEAVLKVQIHAGGRGKAGGVKFAKNHDEILRFAKDLLGLKIVNNQTGPQGIIANKILLTARSQIKKEFYLAIGIDRSKATVVLIASPSGGIDIEEVAAKNPEKILSIPINQTGKIKPFQLIHLAKFMGWTGHIAEQGAEIAQKLLEIFIDFEGILLEINPLVLTEDDKLLVLDVKFSLDENALFRHPEFLEFYDPTQFSVFEAQAHKHNLSYVALNGNIGCMVNGAGLAMATMDIISYYGGVPANFLDIGGGASEEKVAEGFKIVLSDDKVKAILVNIFGGIMNCETFALGLIKAAEQNNVKVPLVIRMEGTFVEQGKKRLAESNLNIVMAEDLADAGKKVVKAAQG